MKGASVLWNKKNQKKFQEAHRLSKDGKSKTEISRLLNIRKPTIIKWLSQDTYNEKREEIHGLTAQWLKKKEDNFRLPEL